MEAGANQFLGHFAPACGRQGSRNPVPWKPTLIKNSSIKKEVVALKTTKLGKLTTFQDVAYLSAGQVLERSLSLCPKKVALIYKGDRIIYEELNNRVDDFASGLASLGLRKGDRFVIDLPNSPELIISFYALAKLGAITTWCNPTYRQKEVDFILRNSGAKGIIIRNEFEDFDYVQMIKEIRKDSQLEHVITVGEGPTTFDKVMALRK